jgi:predicted HicB family RNase H-like nuclease
MGKGSTMLTVEVPTELHTRAKTLAAASGKSLRQVVIEALERLLSRAEKRSNGGK